MLWLKIVVVICLILVLFALLFYLLFRRTTRTWPHPSYVKAAKSPELVNWQKEGLFIAWVGHSTLLMRLDGLYILTDPVFSRKVGVHIPFVTIGPKRHVGPAIQVEDCPQIDVVLLSHAHMDHLDLPSLRRVVGRHTEIVTAPGTASLLKRLPAKAVYELQPGETLTLASGVKLIGQRVKHWGNRFPWYRNQGYLGYVIMRNAWRVFFAGDTAYTPWLQEVCRHQPQVTCMPIGAYAPATFQGAHCTPEQAWEMFLATGASYLIPMHHNTFVLSQEPLQEPMQRLEKAAASRQDAIVIRQQGETFCLH